MESVAQSNGTGSVTVSFEQGTDPEMAQVDVQNRLSRATPRLPSAVTQQGVKVDKSASNFLLFSLLSSSNPDWDVVRIGDYASRNVVPEIQRIEGIGQVQLFGSGERCASRLTLPNWKVSQLSSAQVIAAIRAQNAQVSSGAIGDLPGIAGQGITATVTVRGQLSTRKSLAASILRANTTGAAVRLKDVARIEIGGQTYATTARLNGQPAAGIGVQLSPSGNALAAADVRARQDGRVVKVLPRRDDLLHTLRQL